ncbi:MAG: DUF3293 domain-containing protein [Actinomycetota bacterium]|nr:DUF3293 domain-containing protein [Actinomycetota bacterium]
MIPEELLELYFAASIDLWLPQDLSSDYPREASWRRIYDGSSIDSSAVSEIYRLSTSRFDQSAFEPRGFEEGEVDSASNKSKDHTASIAVITAWNPKGVQRSMAENIIANQDLLSDLQQSGYSLGSSLLEARGSDTSPGASYYEDGYAAFDAVISTLCTLGRKYQQLAIYAIEGDELLVLGCDDGCIYRSPRG